MERSLGSRGEGGGGHIVPLPRGGTPLRSRNRWLHVELGRFLTRDPAEAAIPIITALAFNGDTLDGLAAGTPTLPFSPTGHYADGFNLYQFVGSNPVNRIDPLGLEWGLEEEIDNLIGQYKADVFGAQVKVNQALFMIKGAAKMAALYAAIAFLWDEVVWDQGEAALLGLVTGGFFARACFEEGTQVTLDSGMIEPIECVTVGERVMSWPVESGAHMEDGVVDPAKWRLIRLEANDAERGTISVCLLRDLAWVRATRAEPGRRVWLAVAETGIHRWAEVCSVEPCPAEAAGPIAGLVTGTFQTEKTKVVSVYVDSLAEPIGATTSHPFFSLDRNAWVAAGNLWAGERVRTSDGEATINQVETRATAQTVYNLEVQGTHTYFVSEAKVWVHNGCVPDFAKKSPRNFRQFAKSFSNPRAGRAIARADLAEFTTEARKLGFRIRGPELGSQGKWKDVWHLNLYGPDGGRNLHVLVEAP